MKQLTPQQVRDKIQRYCAYQERSHKEIREKLFQMRVPHLQAEELIATLIVDGFLNEERFAKSFSGGKFRLKKWGRIKIVHALEEKGVSKNCIKSGLKEIDPDDYLETLKKLLQEKSGQLDSTNIFVRRDKLSKYAIQKGYEPQLVWDVLRQMFPE